MKFTHRTIALPTLAALITPCSLTHAEILAVEGEAQIDIYRTFFEDENHEIFGGLDKFLDISFRFQYDTNTPVSSMDGSIATYELDTAGSYIKFGSNTMTFSSLSVQVGTNEQGHGGVAFTARNDLHESMAVVSYGFTNTPLPHELPNLSTNFDFSNSLLYADHDDNEFLLPVITGWDPTGQIIPAPGTMLLVSSGLLAMNRRKRSASVFL